MSDYIIDHSEKAFSIYCILDFFFLDDSTVETGFGTVFHALIVYQTHSLPFHKFPFVLHLFCICSAKFISDKIALPSSSTFSLGIMINQSLTISLKRSKENCTGTCNICVKCCHKELNTGKKMKGTKTEDKKLEK